MLIYIYICKKNIFLSCYFTLYKKNNANDNNHHRICDTPFHPKDEKTEFEVIQNALKGNKRVKLIKL